MNGTVLIIWECECPNMNTTENINELEGEDSQCIKEDESEKD